MMKKIFCAFFILANAFNNSSAFWSLETDLQFGYEIYDRCYEINGAIQAILQLTTRNWIIQTDAVTQGSLAALTAINTRLASAPYNFFNELAYAASSRSYTESWHIARLRTYHATYVNQLEILANATGPLSKLNDITNQLITSTIVKSLSRIQEHSRNVLDGAEEVTLRVAQARANSSLLLTPQLLNEFIDDSITETLTTSLIQLRNSYLLLLSAVRDTARLTAAHGSMYEIMEKSSRKDSTKRNTSLANFVNSYNRVRNTLLSSVVTYRQTAQTGFTNFIQRVQSTYDDTIVRPRFERDQLPLILSFAEVVTQRVYNQTFFETSFDSMRDAIVEAFNNETNSVFAQDSQYRDIILNLLRQSYVRRYASCLNELVSSAQEELNSLTGKYAFCLDERTSSITVVIPSTNSWLSVIRDNVNSILTQLNACITGQTSVSGRTVTADCIQSNANNLQFYAMFLPLTVENNLRPIVQSPPLIFRNCVNIISATNDSVKKFNDIYEKCSSDDESAVTDETTTAVEDTSIIDTTPDYSDMTTMTSDYYLN